MSRIAEVINQQSYLLCEFKSMVGGLVRAQEDDSSFIESQLRTIALLQDTIENLKQFMTHTNKKLEVFKTPPSEATLQGKHHHGVAFGNQSLQYNVAEEMEAEAGQVCTNVLAIETQEKRMTSAPVAPSVPDFQLTYGNEAKTISESRSQKGMDVSSCIKLLYKSGFLKSSNRKNIDPPRHIFTEKSLMVYVLELVESLVSKEEKDILKGSVTDEWLETFATSIEEKCMKKMLEYEGGDPDQESKTKSQKKPTYLAVGARLREYKKFLAHLSGNQRFNLEKLRDRPLVTGPSIPKDNTSITSFFSYQKP